MSRNSNAYKLLDGYNVGSASDGYSFVTQWVPVEDAFAFSISVRFFDNFGSGSGAGGSPSGTLQLNCSNEDSIGLPGGLTGLVGNQGGLGAPGLATSLFGIQPRYNGLDSVPITQPVTSVVTINSLGTTFYDIAQKGFKWIQVQYTGVGPGEALCDVWFNKKWAH